MVTPFKQEGATQREKRMINAHGAIRSLIEDIFGILANKFDRINNFKPTSSEMVMKVILGIACIWNLLQTMGDHRYSVFTYDQLRARRRDYTAYDIRPNLRIVPSGLEKKEILAEWLEQEGLFP